jgi:hypothetical protein
MARSSAHRRLDRLEAAIISAITPEVRALAARMAAEDGDLYTADELLAEVEATMRSIGPPYTTERIARHYAAATGCTVADLMADAARRDRRLPARARQ